MFLSAIIPTKLDIKAARLTNSMCVTGTPCTYPDEVDFRPYGILISGFVLHCLCC